MKENPVLEAFQKEAYEQVAARYKFSASYEGAKEQTSPKLDALIPGIRLHFLRYGLFIKESKNDEAFYIYGQNNKEKDHYSVGEIEVKNDKIPPTENFYIARTTLRKGYVYLFRDGDPNEHYELEINESGNISHVLWSDNKEKGEYLDVRKSQNDAVDFMILTVPNKTFWIAYSPVQWNVKYHNDLLNNEELRVKQGMIKVNCTGFKIDEAVNVNYKTDQVVHYEALKFAHYKEHPGKNRLKKLVKQIDSQERKEDRTGNNEIFEDMFITLDDPVGCADDICIGVDTEVTRLKAIMVSLQTGISSEEAFSYLEKKEQVPVEDTEKSKQIQYLHRLAKLTYDFVYNDHDNTEQYNSNTIESTAVKFLLNLTTIGSLITLTRQKGVKKSKLEKLLGVKERAAQRSVINSYRDDLGNLMKSDYYQDATDDYKYSIADNVEDAKGVLAQHMLTLSQYPNMYDRHLDLKNEFQPKKDTWYNPINETLYNKNPKTFTKSTRILDHKIDIQDIITLDLTGKTVGIMRKILLAYANHSDFKGGYATYALHNKISYFRDKKTRVATFKFKALENFDQYLLENKKQIRLELEGKKVSLKKFKNYWHLEYEKMTAKAAQEFIDDGKVVINLKNAPKRFEQQVKKFYQSGALSGVMLIIESVFWAEAFHKWKEEGGASNRTALQGASIKLGAAITRLAEETKTYEKLLTEETASQFKRYGRFLGIASSSIGVYSLGHSALTSFSYRDTDAALAYGVAAGLSGVLLAADVSALIVSFGGASFLALGFWPAALVGGAIILIIYLIDKYLTDTELEAYFKNFPLSDYALNPNSNELPYRYINRLLDNIEDSISGAGRYDDFKDLEIAFIELTDILTPNYTQVEVLLQQNQLKRAAGRTYHTSMYHVETYNIYVHRFKVHLYANFPCYDVDDLDIKAWFYPDGIKPKANRIEINTFIYDFPKPDSHDFYKKPRPTCSIDFAIPNEFRYYFSEYMFGYEYKNAEVLLLIRIVNNAETNEYTPPIFNNNDRYTHVCMSVKQTYPGYLAKTVELYEPQTHYALQVTTKRVKPTTLTHEQALYKRNIFEINELNNLHSYIPEI